MNRFFQQFRFSLEKKPVDLFMRVTFGLTGAPTLDAVNSKGVASITRTGAGAYDIVLQDVYVRLMSVCELPINASNLAAPNFRVASETVNAPATKKISVQFTNAAGTTATDPGSGEEWRLMITLKGSTAQ